MATAPNGDFEAALQQYLGNNATVTPPSRPQPTSQPPTTAAGGSDFDSALQQYLAPLPQQAPYASGGPKTVYAHQVPANQNQAPPAAPDAPQSQPLEVAPVPIPRGKANTPVPPPVDLSDHPLIRKIPGGFWGSYESATAATQAQNDAAKAGIDIKMTSGGRTPAEQDNLYQAWLARGKTGLPAAPPGTSNHEKGVSYDFDGSDAALKAFEPIAARYGLVRPFPDKDPVHFTYQPEATGNELVWGSKQLAQFRGEKFTPQQQLASQAATAGWDPTAISVFTRQIKQESGFNPNAKSPAGAIGAPQFMPGTLAPYLTKMGLSADDYVKKSDVQMRIYLAHMGALLKGRSGDIAQALSDYNAGAGATDSFIAPTQGSHAQIKPYPETTNYVAQIMHTDPATAQHWIQTGTGPKLDIPNPNVQQQGAIGAMGSSLRKWVMGTMMYPPLAAANFYAGNRDPASFLPNHLQETLEQGMGQRLQDQGISGPNGATDTMIKDTQETARTFGRALVGGLHGFNEMAADGLGAISSSAPQMPFGLRQLGESLTIPAKIAKWSNETIPWAKLAQITAPTSWNAGDQQYFNNMRGGKDFIGFMHQTYTKTPGGIFNPSFWGTDGMLNPGNIGSFGETEIPAMLGNVVSMELMQGGLAKFAPGALQAVGKPGAWVDGFLAKSDNPIAVTARKLGPTFFKDMTTTQAVAATQAAGQGYEDAISSGHSPQAATAYALASATLGAGVGTLLHLGMSTAGGGLAAGAKAMGNQLTPALREVRAAMKVPGNPMLTDVAPTFLKLLQVLDQPGPGRPQGWFTQALQDKLMASTAVSNDFRALNEQQNTAQRLLEHGQKIDQLSQTISKQVAKVDQDIAHQQKTLQALQETEALWKRLPQNADLLNNATFNDAVQLHQAINGGQLAADAPMDAFKGKSPRAALDGLLKKLTPNDAAQVEVYSNHQSAMADANANLQQLQQSLPPELRAQLQDDQLAMGSVSAYLQRAANQLQGKPFDVGLHEIEQKMPGGMLPKDEAGYEAVMDTLHKNWKQIAADGLSLMSTSGAQLDNLVSTTLRSLLDVSSQTGDVGSRLGYLLDDLNNQRQQLLAQEPVRPTRPSAVNLSVKDKRYTTGKYTQEEATYQRDLEIYKSQLERHNADVDALDRHIASLQEPLEAGQDWLRSSKSIPQGIKQEFTDDAEKDLNNRLAAAGVKGGLEQLDRIYNAPTVDAKKAFKEFWQADPELRKLGSARKLQPSDLSRVARNEFEGALEDGQKFVKVHLPLEWVSAPETDPAKVAHLEANAAAGLGSDQAEGIGRGSQVLKRPVMLGGRMSDDGTLGILDGNARVQRLMDLGRKEVQAYVREDRLIDFLRSKLGSETHDAIAGARGDLPTPSDRDLWKMLAGLGNPDAYSRLAEGLSAPTSQTVETPAVAGSSPLGQGSYSLETARSGNRPGWEDDGTSLQPQHVTSKGEVRDLPWLEPYKNSELQTGLAPNATPATSGVLPQDADTRQKIDFNSRIGSNQVSPSGLMNNDITMQARERWNGLAPEQMRAAVDNVWAKYADTFNTQATPSELAQRTILGQGDPLFNGGAPEPAASWLDSLGASWRSFLLENREAQEATRQHLDFVQPKMPGDALSTAIDPLRTWFHRGVAGERMTDLHIAQVADHYENALKASNIKRVDGKLPQEFAEKQMDAIESMFTEPQQMQALLRQYPPLRQALASVFEMHKMNEVFQVADPEMQNLFNQTNFLHIFPEQQKRAAQMAGDTGMQAKAFTQLNQDRARKIPTFAQARDIANNAISKVMSAPGWAAIPGAMDRVKGGNADAILDRFYTMSSAQRSALWAGTQDDKAIAQLLHGAALRNPVSDPVEALRIQAKSIVRASNNRNLLANLTNIAAPGAGIGAHGRPIAVLEYVPEGQTAPSAPSLKGKLATNQDKAFSLGVPEGEASATYTPLSSGVMGYRPGDQIKIGGKLYPANRMFLHGDVADIIASHYWQPPSEGSGMMAKLLQVLRTARLAGGTAIHLLNINANMAGSFGGMALQNLQRSFSALTGGDLPEAATQAKAAALGFARAPFGGLQAGIAGEKMSSDLTLKTRYMLAGLNLRTQDEAVKGMARQAMQVYDQTGLFPNPTPQAPEGSFMNEVQQRAQESRDWNTARDAQMLGGDVNVWKKIGTGFRAFEHWACFGAIESAMLGMTAHYENTLFEDVGRRLIARGVPPTVALQQCTNAAVQMVNRLGGAPQSYLTPNSIRNKLYNSIWGVFTPGGLSPAWWATKIQTITAALPGMDAETGQGGFSQMRQALNDKLPSPTLFTSKDLGTAGALAQTAAQRADRALTGGYNNLNAYPELADYQRGQSRKAIAATLLGGVGAISLAKWLARDPGDPSDPQAWNSVRLGNKSYPLPVWGSLNTFMSGLGRTGGPLDWKGLMNVAGDQSVGLFGLIAQENENRGWNGRPIYTDEDGMSQLERLRYEDAPMAGYALSQAINLEPVRAIFDPNKSLGETLANVAGISGREPNNAARDKAQLAQLKEAPSQRLHDSVEALLDTVTQRDRPLRDANGNLVPGPLTHTNDQIAEATKQLRTLTLEQGVPLMTPEQKLFPQFAGTNYTWTPQQLQQALSKRAERWGGIPIIGRKTDAATAEEMRARAAGRFPDAPNDNLAK